MIIETERLLLRPFQEGDEEDVFEYLNEPAVNCFASMKLHSLEEAREEVLKRSSETEYYFAIVLKESGKVIGEQEVRSSRGSPVRRRSPSAPSRIPPSGGTARQWRGRPAFRCPSPTR